MSGSGLVDLVDAGREDRQSVGPSGEGEAPVVAEEGGELRSKFERARQVKSVESAEARRIELLRPLEQFEAHVAKLEAVKLPAGVFEITLHQPVAAQRAMNFDPRDRRRHDMPALLDETFELLAPGFVQKEFQ